MSSLLTIPDTLGMLGQALAAHTNYGKVAAPTVDLAEEDPKTRLLRNRKMYGENKAMQYGKIPAALGAIPAAGYEAVKAVAMSDKQPFDVMAKDALMYVGRSPLGALWYDSPADAWANDPTSTELFTVDRTTRKANPETVAAYARGVGEADAPLVNTRSLAEALSGLFRGEQ
jgi:hypothetical protein